MYKLIFTLIISILALTTLCIGFSQPKMHKSVFVYNSDYIIETASKIETIKSLPTQINTPKIKKVVEKASSITQPTTKNIKKVTSEKVEVKSTPVETIKTVETSNPLLSLLNESKKTITVKPKFEKEIVKLPSVTVLTEQEKVEQEVILWNIWRSNLQNKIMSDVKLPIMPDGTVFRFSFDVDKFGRISNVQTWSLTPSCTPYAIQFIAPVIRSYQGKSILNFPEGSNRMATTVEGGWKISKTAKFSTPQDYSDSEKIIKD